MEIIEIANQTATFRLNRTEITILANAINETREALEDWEFEARVGAEPAEAEDLRQKLKALLASMREAG